MIGCNGFWEGVHFPTRPSETGRSLPSRPPFPIGSRNMVGATSDLGCRSTLDYRHKDWHLHAMPFVIHIAIANSGRINHPA